LIIDKGISAKQQEEGKYCTTSRLIFKTVWAKLQLIYWYTWGHFFCFGCSNAKKEKKKRKDLHVPANACSPCKKIYKIA
jgi:hypothetical protein